MALEVYANRTQKITTSKLNEFLEATLAAHTPPAHRGKLIKIKYGVQLPTPYPTFALFCNYPDHVEESYKQYLENRFRERFNFTGTPITLFFREK